MLSDFAREKSTSTGFTPNGVYDGIVRRVDSASKTAWIELPRVAEGFEFGPLVCTTIQMPRVGDKVACMFMEDRVDDVIVLGVQLSDDSPIHLVPVSCLSTDLPASPEEGKIVWQRDINELAVWDGTTWLSLSEMLDASYVNISGDTMTGALSIAVGTKTLKLSSDNTAALIGTGDEVGVLRMVGGIADGIAEGGTIAVYGNNHATFPATVRILSNLVERIKVNSVQTYVTGDLGISGGASVTANLAVTGNVTTSGLTASGLATGNGMVPAGTILDYVGTTAPTGWTILDGSTLTAAQTLYPALWAVAPTGWRSGADLVLPDARGRVTVAKAASGTFATIAATGGAETHTLTAAEIPAHTHTIDHDHASFTSGTESAHTHDAGTLKASQSTAAGANNISGRASSSANQGTVTDTVNISGATAAGSSHTHTIDVPAFTGSSGNGTGGGGSHNNLQPYIVFVKIMKIH